MKSSTPAFPRDPQCGSAFITVLLFTFLLFTLTASILQWSVNERRMNSRAGYWLEARNAAEAVAEYGFSQISNEYNDHASPPSLDPSGSSALTLPPTTFFSGSDVATSSLQLIGGNAANIPSSGALYYVDPNDPNNQYDPLKGQYVYRRDVEVLAKATVNPPNGDSPVTAYVTEKVSVRGAPLFAHAIFYSNNDLEIAPGPNFDIYGPVHVNGNLILSAQGSVETGSANYISFHGTVSASGDIYRAWGNVNPAGDGRGYRSSSSTMNGEPLGYDPLNFLTSAGTLVNLKDSSGTWRDSTLGTDTSLFDSYGQYTNTSTSALSQLQAKRSSNFRTTAAQVWGGNLQTEAMGVAEYNPIAFNEVIDSSGDTPDPHALIDPPDTTLSTSDPYYSAKEEVENQKFSNQSGLYVQVTVTPGTSGSADSASTIALYGPAGSAAAAGVTDSSKIGPNGGILLGSYTTGSTPNGLVAFIPGEAQSVAKGSKITTRSDPNYGKYPFTTTTYTGSGTLSGSTYTPNSSSSTTYSSSGSTGTSVPSGMYDQRQLAPINMVQIDLGALRSALTDANANSNSDSKAILDSSGNVWGSTQWNGGVYVEVKTSDGSATQTSVTLANGKVSSGSLIPTVNDVAGVTIATNAPMYILGNLNADGSNTTSSSAATTPDDGKTDAAGTATSGEVPVALAADAITFLSPNYFGTSSGTNLVPSTNSSSSSAFGSASSTSPSASGSMEVAAAMITGIVATSSTAYSGGVHNLPRFIENWGSNTVAIRGSLVSMYDSKVAVGPWAQRYYSAPKRNWGFDVIFQNGTYPPLTPKVMSYRRVEFTDLSETDYASQRHSLWPSEY